MPACDGSLYLRQRKADMNYVDWNAGGVHPAQDAPACAAQLSMGAVTGGAHKGQAAHACCLQSRLETI